MILDMLPRALRELDAPPRPQDYRLLLVFYFGMIALFAGLLAYGRLRLGWAIPWRTGALGIVLIALMFQTGIAFMLAGAARRAKTKITGYVLSATSFALLLALPVLSRSL